MNEFLKLCNLFSQDLIDKAVLVSRASNFIGANPELMAWFKRFVSYDGRDEIIENKPRPPASKVILSNCRGYGPSYRLLPKRVCQESSFTYSEDFVVSCVSLSLIDNTACRRVFTTRIFALSSASILGPLLLRL